MVAYKNPNPTVDFIPKVDKKDLEIEVNKYTEHKTVYFVFLDVLGFKKAFDENRQPNLHDQEFAEKFNKVFIYYFDLMGAANFKMYEAPLCHEGQTSDSLYFYTDRVDLLIQFIKIFSHLYVYAMSEDVLFRGGIAKGNLFSKEKYQFYGESVINAYLLESEISKNPIVVIDQNTLNDIKNHLSESEFDKLINTGSVNGRNFVKPFAYLENTYELDIFKEFEIKEIKDEDLNNIIEINKSKFEYDAKNYQKYVFLKNEFDEYKNNKSSKIGG